jgi:hypothetical protein
MAGVRIQAQCDPGDILVGEDDDQYYCMKQSSYVGSAAEKDAKEYNRAHLRVVGLQNALKQFGFAVDNDRYALYAETAKDQIDDVKRKLVSSLIDGAIDGSVLSADKLKSLNPWNVNTAIHDLEKYGADFDPLVKALRKVARTAGKPEAAAAYREFAEVAKDAKEGWMSADAADRDPANQKLIFLLGALKVLQSSPEASWGVSAGEMVENLAYLGYLTNQVDALGAVTDDKLVQLGSLSKRLQTEVQAMNVIRDRWRVETGFPKARPILASES